MIKLKNLLTEDVHGVKSIVYHRTNKDENFNNILNAGFDPGYGDMYGKGLYTTYHPTSKYSPNSRYGPIQIKFMVEVVDFFIFDYDIYKKNNTHIRRVEEKTGQKSNIYNFIDLQAKYFEIIPKREYAHYNLSSEKALAMGFNKRHKYYHKVNGIIFTGQHDGNVLVCYNTNLAVPLSYTDDNTGKTIHLKDIKNSDAFYQRYITGSMSRYDSLAKSPTDLKLDREKIAAKYKLVFNDKTKLYDSSHAVHIEDDLINYNGELMISFGKVKEFSCIYSIKSFKGFPIEVENDVQCGHLQISSFKGFPIKYAKKLILHDCNSIQSFDGIQNSVFSDISISRCNGLKTLDGLPKSLNGDIDIIDCNNLYSLKGMPDHIKSLKISKCYSITSLEGCSKYIDINCSFGGLEGLRTLEHAPIEVGQTFSIYGCSALKVIDYLPKAHNYSLDSRIQTVPDKYNHLIANGMKNDLIASYRNLVETDDGYINAKCSILINNKDTGLELRTEKIIHKNEMIVPFGNINGNFKIENVELKSFKNFPKSIDGILYINKCIIDDVRNIPNANAYEISDDIQKKLSQQDKNKIKRANIKYSIKDVKHWKYDKTTKMMDYYGDLSINNAILIDGKLIFNINEVHGMVQCEDMHLKTLDGFPQIVKYLVNIDNTDITSLKNGPKIVGNTFNCSNNDFLESIQDMPKIINTRTGRSMEGQNNISIFICSNISLKSLEGLPEVVDGYLSIRGCTALESLKGAPKHVVDEFNCDKCTSLKSLEYLPKSKKYKVPEHLKDELQRILKDRGEIK